MAFKKGSHGPEVRRFQEFMNRAYKSYSNIAVDEYYGNDEARVVSEAQRRLGLPITGEADDVFLARIGFLKVNNVVPVPGPGATWVYSAAGTSAKWWMGPPFAVGEYAKTKSANHQPLDYPAGGFFGMGNTDPTISYNESIFALKMEMARMLRVNSSGKLIFVGYSQSADGMRRAIAELFNDGGEFQMRRGHIKGCIMFGDPTRYKGSTKYGNNPPGWGIARFVAPQWLDNLTYDIVTHNDMYACATDDTLLPLFYEWFIRSEVELPFVFYCAQIVIPALMSYFAIGLPLVGGLLGVGGSAVLAGLTGVGLPLITQLIGGFSNAASPNPELIEALSAQGLLQNAPKLIKTLMALGGLQAHNEYHIPKPEFNALSGIQVGCTYIDRFMS